MHARAVGVEDSRHLDANAVLAMIVEEQGFRRALAFIVTGPQPQRIDVAPIGFRLRMNVRVAVDLAGRGLKNLGFDALGKTQHVDRAMHAGLQRLHRIELIVDRRRRAR